MSYYTNIPTISAELGVCIRHRAPVTTDDSLHCLSRADVPCVPFLTVREAAFLVQRPEMVVWRMIEAGRLRCVGDWETADGRQRRRLSPDSVREQFPDDGSYELRRLAMGAILAGRLRVPAPGSRWGAPAPLEHVVDALGAHSIRSTTKSRATSDRALTVIDHINHRVNFTYNGQ